VIGELKCDVDSSEPAGGGYYGTDTPGVRLVD
jgi:hypothetical protein